MLCNIIYKSVELIHRPAAKDRFIFLAVLSTMTMLQVELNKFLTRLTCAREEQEDNVFSFLWYLLVGRSEDEFLRILYRALVFRYLLLWT